MTGELPQRLPGESIKSFVYRRAAALGHPIKPEEAPIMWPDGLVPAEEPIMVNPDIAHERYELDKVLEEIDCIDAYNRWIPKRKVDRTSKTHNIMISCPLPEHPDEHPSADINLEKGEGGVWHCHRCQDGGDKFDLAAIGFGLPRPGYKDDFPALKRRMAVDLGYTPMVQGKEEWLERSDQTIQPQPVIIPPLVPSPDNPFFEEGDDHTTIPAFDWRELEMEPESFLYTWQLITSSSYEPEEFYLWQGLMAIGAACGNNVVYDDTIPVRPNLMTCLVGTTGSGKSISMSVFGNLISEALPWRPLSGEGVNQISSPGSGEALLDMFNYSSTDPATGVKTNYPVNGLYRESELSAFMKRTSRHGSTIREIMMDLFDRATPVASHTRTMGTVIARDHFMQMVTSIQPESLARNLSDADASAGFLNRFVFAFGPSKIRPPRNAKTVDVHPAVDALRSIRAWASAKRHVHFVDGSPAAQAWDEFYLESIHPLTNREDAWLAARLPLLAKKLVMLFAVNEHCEEIDVSHVDCVKRMWKYILKCYGVVGLNFGVDKVEGCANKIEKYFKERPNKELTFRDIQKQSAARNESRELILRSIDILLRGSVIQEVPHKQGTKVTRYIYVP